MQIWYYHIWASSASPAKSTSVFVDVEDNYNNEAAVARQIQLLSPTRVQGHNGNMMEQQTLLLLCSFAGVVLIVVWWNVHHAHVITQQCCCGKCQCCHCFKHCFCLVRHFWDPVVTGGTTMMTTAEHNNPANLNPLFVNDDDMIMCTLFSSPSLSLPWQQQ